MTERKPGPSRSAQSRKDFFFETQSRTGEYSPAALKSVEEYLRDTPPTPLSPLTKAGLIALGVLVVVLFVVDLVVGVTKTKTRAPRSEPPRSSAVVDPAPARSPV